MDDQSQKDIDWATRIMAQDADDSDDLLEDSDDLLENSDDLLENLEDLLEDSGDRYSPQPRSSFTSSTRPRPQLSPRSQFTTSKSAEKELTLPAVETIFTGIVAYGALGLYFYTQTRSLRDAVNKAKEALKECETQQKDPQ